jgi:DNA-directed DNA polymerase III PolC
MSIFAHIFSTEYSNEEAYGKLDKENKQMIKAWAEHAKLSGDPEPALIIADKFSATAQIPFFSACLEYGVKPVFGVKAVVQGKDGADHHEVILVAKNETGRQNINRIITEGHKVTPTKGYKLITTQDLEAYKDGLICISGGPNGLVEKTILKGNYNGAKNIANHFNKIFKDNFYIQVRKTSNDIAGQQDELKIIEAAKKISAETGIKLVANNDVRFVNKEDYKYHITKKTIINSRLSYDPARKVLESENQYLLPIAHMLELFKDMPESVFNMGELVDSTDIMDFKNRLGKSVLPKFPIPDEFNEDAVLYLKHITDVGFEERWEKIDKVFNTQMGQKTKKGELITPEFIAAQKEHYRERIVFELDVIEKTKFAGYFLIVHELVNWCKQNDIPVGPGRGSGAGSLVLFSLNITNVDPIPHDLLFERFLNPERVSEPDIDIDFSPINRERVIQHMKDMYGEENTAQILTEGTMAARSVIDSIGRVRGMKPEERDKIKNLISDELGTTISKEMTTNEKLIDLCKKSRQVRRIIEEALKLEKSVVSYGKHAGGVVISLGDMAQYAPLYRENGENSPVVQFNKDICEKIGLIKFDILGLKNLDIIQDCVKAINSGRAKNKQLDMDDIPLDDPLTISLFKQADTYGIFQFESIGMRRLMKDLSPDNFEELVALVALFRPGPLQSKMDKDFIERKFNASKIVYPHARLKETLGPTYGTIIYQEQVMSIARELAGYSLGQADILRKAMGKKDMEIMAKQRAMFLDGCMDSFRDETLVNTAAKMKSPINPEQKIAVDLNFDKTKSTTLKNILGEGTTKFVNIEQVVKVLKEYANVPENELNIFKLEVDGMDDKQFYGSYHNLLMKNGSQKLMNEGLSQEEAIKEMAAVSVATSMFVRFNKIFSLMHKFAAYGFNKSHSVAYALVSFQTAYLKAHYPSQYMAAMLTNESNIESVSETLIEARRMGLNVMKPDLNLSDVKFKALTSEAKEKNIVYGLAQIKGINKSVEHLVKIRKEKGNFVDIFDFYDKCGSYKIIDVTEKLDGTTKTIKKTLIGKSVLNNLLNAGVLDSICPNQDPKYRATLQATYNFLDEVVGDMTKRLNSNYREIQKALKLWMKSPDVDSYIQKHANVFFESGNEAIKEKAVELSKKATPVEIFLQEISNELFNGVSPEEMLTPENLSNFNFENLAIAYQRIEEKILESGPKKALVLKKVNNYHDEIETFKPEVKKITLLDSTGKKSIYIEPTSVNYADVPEPKTKQTSFKEYELTGMYQSINPIDLGDIKKILESKDIVCSSSKDLAQQVDTFGKLSEKTGKKYYQTAFAGTIVELKDFKRTNNETGEPYIDITASVDDGNGIVTVKFTAEKTFLSGKEQRGIDMLKDMMKKEVLIFEGSASNASYASAGVTIFAKRIGSTNPEFYLPLEDPSLNFLQNEKEQYIKKVKSEELATDAQLNKVASLLKRNNVAFTDVFKEFKIEELKELKKSEASQIIQKYIDNKPTP